ncbi:MAG: sulfatase-like hydrolase/transferase, partial [Akkermansiaceae bacterium]
MKYFPFAFAAVVFSAVEFTSAETIILSTRTESVMVGESDSVGGSTAPLAVGDGWFTGVHAGTLRQRSTTQFELRTQWYFRFDLADIATLAPEDILGVTLKLPQIGRLNGNPSDNVPMRMFDPNANWDLSGTNYPKWNLGREAPNHTGGSGGTLLASFPDAYDTFGEGPTDTSNVNVEGTFTSSSAALLTMVKGWVTSGTNNEGIMATLPGLGNIGLAFGDPVLEIEIVNGALVDTDDDGMPDFYETANGTQINVNDAALDEDEDGLSNLQEYLGQDENGVATPYGRTLSGMADSDGDSLDDGDEISGTLNPWSAGVFGTPPGDPTNPNLADSDNEGANDGMEITNGTDPNASPPNTGPIFTFTDTDGDSYSDQAEVAFGSDPNVANSSPDHTPPAGKPNVVVIYADDLGFGDISAYGDLYGTPSPTVTPNVNALAAQGVMFTQAHSSNGVCTPSRYALLTGKYNWREFDGITLHYGGQRGGGEVPRASDVTIADFLKTENYDTAAFGKWHLGGAWYTTGGARITNNPTTASTVDWARPIEHHAVAQGFDTFRGLGVTINVGPYVYLQDDRVQFWDTTLNGGAGEYRDATNSDPFRWLTTSELNSTVVAGFDSRASLGDPSYTQVGAEPRMIEDVEGWFSDRSSSGDTDPFFTYVSMYSPHKPWAITPPFNGIEGFSYGDFMKEVDDRVGRIIAAIDDNGFGTNTVVIFTSDNGPENTAMTNTIANGRDANGPLRGNKRDVWDGGTRVPFIVRWPGQAAAGTVRNDLIWQGDIFATIAAYLRVDLADTVAPDGESFLNILRGQEKPEKKRTSMIVSAGRGDLGVKTLDGWKLIDSSGGGDGTSWDSSNAVISGAAGTNKGTPKQLFHQAIDLGEDDNLISGLTTSAAIRAGSITLTGVDLLGVVDEYRTSTTAQIFPRAADNDADGLPNSFELTYALNPDSPKDAEEDLDGDGST